MDLTITTQIEQTLESLDAVKMAEYLAYWDSITPTSNRDYYWRWIFAFLSVHTSWEKNVESYRLLYTRPEWQRDGMTQLLDLIKESRAGLYNIRSKGIWGFHEDFWKDPNVWYKREDETWVQCRDRLMDKLHGLGLAKTAFALEMCYPRTCGVLCADTHIIQLYGYQPEKMNARKYREIETHWIGTCQRLNIPSPIARCVYWDTKQHQPSSRYWSYVLEPDQLRQTSPPQEWVAPPVEATIPGALVLEQI